MPEPALNSNMLCQIGFVVNDVVASAKKYSETFGLPMPNIIETPGYELSKTTVNGQPSEATAKLAFFQTGQLVVELIQPSEHPSAWRDHLNKYGEGVHHIAFQVADTKATEAALSKFGIETTMQGLYADASGMFTYLDSIPQLGVMLELLEDFKE